MVIDHIDGDNKNNRLENLQELTVAENNRKASKEYNFGNRTRYMVKDFNTNEERIMISDELLNKYGVSRTEMRKYARIPGHKYKSKDGKVHLSIIKCVSTSKSIS